ncbi:MAG: ACP S-malonyltransferase [Chloroflexota bacterium]
MDVLQVLKARIALIFPGQGSQYVGMGKALCEASPAARQVFEQADNILEFPLSTLCFEGPQEELDDTINAQPAILTVSIACLEALKEQLGPLGYVLTPSLVAGHSLGEFTALVAAGVLDFEDALKLVRERGRLMKESGVERPGGMLAVVGLDDATLDEVVHEAQSAGIVALANANSPGQTVLSGELAAIQRAMELARARGARLVKQLAISIASHSPLMAQAAQRFNRLLSQIQLRPPEIPLIANISAQALTTVEELRVELSEQLIRPVQWTRSVQTMMSQGIDTFVEVGPRHVLSGLIRRINTDVRSVSLSDVEVVRLREEIQSMVTGISNTPAIGDEQHA